MNIDRNTYSADPFQQGLSILARIIARKYWWALFISNLYIPCSGPRVYTGWGNHFECLIKGDDGATYLITATLPSL